MYVHIFQNKMCTTTTYARHIFVHNHTFSCIFHLLAREGPDDKASPSLNSCLRWRCFHRDFFGIDALQILSSAACRCACTDDTTDEADVPSDSGGDEDLLLRLRGCISDY